MGLQFNTKFCLLGDVFSPFQTFRGNPSSSPLPLLSFFWKMLLLASAVGETETGAEAHKETNQWLAER